MVDSVVINGAAINEGAALDEEAYQLWLRDPKAKVCNLVEIDYHGTSAAYPDWDVFTLKLCDIAPSFGGYKDVVKSLPAFTQQIGDDFTGTVVASIGTVDLDNTNGALDLWHNLSFDGQRCRHFHGDPSWERVRFRLVKECLAEVVTSATWDTLSIRLRGLSYTANGPIQTSLLPPAVGANASSSQPIPLAWGQVFNIAPPYVDEVNQVLQWNDGAVTSATAGRDGGYPFQTAQILISAVNVATNIFSTATAHGFYRDTRVRFDIGTMPTDVGFKCIAWNGKILCAPSYYVPSTGLASDVVVTSMDGITWVPHEMPCIGFWRAIEWNGKVFCAVASSSSIAATSPDGINWVQRALPVSTSWSAIRWNGEVFCAIGGASIAATSADGITWVQRTLPTTVGYWSALEWNGTVFCAVSSSDSIAATSADGITWASHSLPALTAGKVWIAIRWNGQLFCAIAQNSSIAATSPDGATWTQRALPVSEYWSALEWNGTVYCAVVQNNTTISATSADGITWVQRALPTNGDWAAVEWNGYVFCAVSYAPPLAFTSADGITWSADAAALPAPLVIDTDYWVIADSLTTTNFKLAATRGGSEIDITGTNIGGAMIGFHWTPDLTTGKVYLDSKPAGVFTMDGVAGDTLAGDILPTVLDATNVDPQSKTIFLSTCPQALGIFVKERRNRLDIADEIITGLGAWYGYGREGMLRFGRIESSYANHDHELIEDDMVLNSLQIERLVPPKKRNRMQYRRNWTNQSGTMVAGVSAEARQLYSTDYSVSAPAAIGADEGSDGSEYHLLAQFPDAQPSLMALASDAATEGARRDTLFYGWGAVFECVVGRIGTEIDIGDVVKVTHSRYGLGSGVRMPVVGFEDSPSAGTTKLRFFAALAAYSPGQL